MARHSLGTFESNVVENVLHQHAKLILIKTLFTYCLNDWCDTDFGLFLARTGVAGFTSLLLCL